MRALRLHFEAAQTLDLAAEEVEAQRLVVAGCEQVEDAAADREVAHLSDQVDAAIAERRQSVRELFEVDLGAAAQNDGGEARGLRQSPEQGPRRDQQSAQATSQGVGERRDLLRPHRERSLGLLVGRKRRRREVPAHPFARHQTQTLHPGEGVRLVRHHHDHRPFGPFGNQVEHPSSGRWRQTRGASTAGCEVGGKGGEERTLGDPQGEVSPRRGTAHAGKSIEASARLPGRKRLRRADAPRSPSRWVGRIPAPAERMAEVQPAGRLPAGRPNEPAGPAHPRKQLRSAVASPRTAR